MDDYGNGGEEAFYIRFFLLFDTMNSFTSTVIKLMGHKFLFLPFLKKIKKQRKERVGEREGESRDSSLNLIHHCSEVFIVIFVEQGNGLRKGQGQVYLRAESV